jgi:hypothetical protein
MIVIDFQAGNRATSLCSVAKRATSWLRLPLRKARKSLEAGIKRQILFGRSAMMIKSIAVRFQASGMVGITIDYGE